MNKPGRVNWRPAEISKPNSLSRKLAHALIVSAGVRFVGMGLTLVVGVQLARYLGPEEYGVYAAATALAALLAVPAQLGLPQLITREVSAGLATGVHGRVRGALICFAVIVIAAGCLMTAIGFLGIQLWPWLKTVSFTTAYAWALAAIPLTAFLSLVLGALRGFHRVISAQAYDALLRQALMAIFIITMFVSSGPMTAATATSLQVGAGIVTLLASILHLLSAMPEAVRQATTMRSSNEWKRSALPMMGTEVVRTIDGQYPVLLLGALAPIDEVGIFRVAFALVALIGFPSTVVNLVIMPHAAQLHAERKTQQLQLIAFASAAILVASTMIITLAIYVFGRPLIGFIFGYEFLPAWFPLVLMGIAYIISGMFGSAAMILNMCGEERKLAQVYLVGPILGIVLTLVAFSWLGIAAVAIAMIVSELVKGLWMTLVAYRKLGIHVSIFAITALLAPKPSETKHRVKGL